MKAGGLIAYLVTPWIRCFEGFSGDVKILGDT